MATPADVRDVLCVALASDESGNAAENFRAWEEDGDDLIVTFHNGQRFRVRASETPRIDLGIEHA